MKKHILCLLIATILICFNINVLKVDAMVEVLATGDDKVNNTSLEYVTCGDLEKIPKPIPMMTSFAYNALKILTPVVLIFMGMVGLMKSIMAGKTDEISKAQSSFIKKLLIAALVFLLASVIQFVVKFTAKSSDSGSVITCMECFLNNNC